MLPALTFNAARFPRRRLAAAVVAALALVATGATAIMGAAPRSDESSAAHTLASRLATSTWGFVLPLSWLATPLTPVRPGDKLDLMAVRQGERPLAIPLAADLRVMSSDEIAVVLEVDEESATAIASARASNLTIVPLLRSTR